MPAVERGQDMGVVSVGRQIRRSEIAGVGPGETPIPGMANLDRLIRDVPDFPRPGVLFKDITPLLADPAGLALSVELMVQPFRGKPIETVAGAESRGFIFGTALANALSVGFVPIRKPGKLPARVRGYEYRSEYGQDRLEIHEDALRQKERVLIVDDVLATGGTLHACCKLVESFGANVAAIVVLLEIRALGGRQRLNGYDVRTVLSY